jgi:hypothetical protein
VVFIERFAAVVLKFLLAVEPVLFGFTFVLFAVTPLLLAIALFLFFVLPRFVIVALRFDKFLPCGWCLRGKSARSESKREKQKPGGNSRDEYLPE